MKLMKIRDNSHNISSFIICGFDLDKNGQIWHRTNRMYNLSDCYNAVLHKRYFLMEPSQFKLALGEQLIYSIEFQELDELFDLVPEEFL